MNKRQRKKAWKKLLVDPEYQLAMKQYMNAYIEAVMTPSPFMEWLTSEH